MKTIDGVVIFLLSLSVVIGVVNFRDRMSFYEEQSKRLAQMELDNVNAANEILDSVKEIENKIKAMEKK